MNQKQAEDLVCGSHGWLNTERLVTGKATQGRSHNSLKDILSNYLPDLGLGEEKQKVF